MVNSSAKSTRNEKSFEEGEGALDDEGHERGGDGAVEDRGDVVQREARADRLAGPDERPRCHCGETRIRQTAVSRKPRVTGKVLTVPIATPTEVEPMGEKPETVQ